MKHSELRQLVREELSKVLNENQFEDEINSNFQDKVGFNGPDPSTKNIMKYETLPGYSELPESRKDIDWKNRKNILLPSSFDPNADDQLFSKEDVKEWYKDFVTKFKEAPQFKVEGTKIKVLNGLKSDFKGMKDFGGLD
jgi:hypothetical protein